MKIILPENVKKILSRLNESGFEGFAVGGCVRDSILSTPPGDWDITTSALPDDFFRVFKGMKIVPTGIKHGTVTVIINGENYEVTTYRIDGAYSDGRRPDDVTFTSQLTEDLRRRDFTINAMAYNDNYGLVDCFGGADDIALRIIRCVGDPEERFSEDYLRMLRTFRFAAKLGFDISPDVLSAIEANKNKIMGISAERIRIETEKTLLTNNLPVITEFLRVFGELIFGSDMDTSLGIESFPKLESDFPLRFSALFFHHKNRAETALRVLKNLRYDNKTLKTVTELLAYSENPIPDEYVIRKLLFNLGENAPRMIKLHYAFSGSPDESLAVLNQILLRGDPCELKKLAVTGADLIELGLSGMQIGEALEKLMDMVLRQPQKNNREFLLGQLN